MFTTERKIEIQINSDFCKFDFDADVIAWSYEREQQSVLRHVEIVIDEPEEVIVREYIQLEPMTVDTIASHVFDDINEVEEYDILEPYTPVSFDEVLIQVGNSVDYTQYSVKELKEIVKSQGHRNFSKMKKTELIDLAQTTPTQHTRVTLKGLKALAKCVRLPNRSKYKTKADLFSVLDKYFSDLGESLIDRLY